MKLNILLLSHPLIKIFTKSLKSNNDTNKQSLKSTYKYIGIFFIYEILRKILLTKNIYIYKLDYIKEICMLDNKQINYVISDVVNNFDMLTDIEKIFPQINLQHINFSTSNTWKNIKVKNINDTTNIIILDKFIKNDNIVKLIEYLHKEEEINTKNIRIACITCTNKILEKISLKYTNLNIYTTNIIDS